jgi:hypothetical protein
MKNILTTFLLLISISLSAQILSEINNELKIPDSLTFEKEIRIYRGFGITNLTEIFRMYQDDSDDWKIESYRFYQDFENFKKSKIEKTELTAKTNAEFAWVSLLQTKVSELPDMSDIRYKMQKRGKVELIDGEYQTMNEELFITDGTGYALKVRNHDKLNEIYYDNPEIYLKHYPEIDELIFFSELLGIIRTEFTIWKE